jgi:hypothetical protein
VSAVLSDGAPVAAESVEQNAQAGFPLDKSPIWLCFSNVNCLHRSGDAPQPIEAGDANCDGMVNVGDLVFLVNYLCKDGRPPVPGCF